MAGRTAASCLSDQVLELGGFSFSPALPADDAALREILRQTPMDGSVQLAFAREPSAFGTDFGLPLAHGFVIARHAASGEIAGICERSVRVTYIDGEPVPLPYLSGLRIARAFRNRLAVLKGGFAAVRAFLETPHDLPYALTSIGVENHPANRLLGSDLAGLPAYAPAGEISSFTLRTRASKTSSAIEIASEADLPAIAAFLQRTYRRFQFAPVWRSADLMHLHRSGILGAHDFLIARGGSGIAACMALWDQTPVKQTIVVGYSPWLGRTRHLLNLLAPLSRSPRLPPAGSQLRFAFLSHVAVENEDPGLFGQLLSAGMSLARRRNFETVVTGLAAAHPFASLLRDRRAFEYRTRLYRVYWPEMQPFVPPLGDSAPHPEIGLL
jgi:hypothetical protein